MLPPGFMTRDQMCYLSTTDRLQKSFFVKETLTFPESTINSSQKTVINMTTTMEFKKKIHETEFCFREEVATV